MSTIVTFTILAGAFDGALELEGEGEEVTELDLEGEGEEVTDDVGEGEEVTDDVMEEVAVADFVGGGLGSERTGLGPHSYIPGGQVYISEPLTSIISMHTSLFSSGCWQGPEVKWWHIAVQPIFIGFSTSSED